MKLVNDLIKVPQLQATMAQMSREMMRAGMIDEAMGDAIDSAVDTDTMEEETEAEVDKVQHIAGLPRSLAAIGFTSCQVSQKSVHYQRSVQYLARVAVPVGCQGHHGA